MVAFGIGRFAIHPNVMGNRRMNGTRSVCATVNRWAMEVLGLRGGMDVERDDVNRRFRRLLRDAHPDSGGASASAASRIAELTEARTILMSVAVEAVAAEG